MAPDVDAAVEIAAPSASRDDRPAAISIAVVRADAAHSSAVRAWEGVEGGAPEAASATACGGSNVLGGAVVRADAAHSSAVRAWEGGAPEAASATACGGSIVLGGRISPPSRVVCVPRKVLVPPTEPYSMPLAGRWSVPSCRRGSEETAAFLRRSACTIPSRTTSHGKQGGQVLACYRDRRACAPAPAGLEVGADVGRVLGLLALAFAVEVVQRARLSAHRADALAVLLRRELLGGFAKVPERDHHGFGT